MSASTAVGQAPETSTELSPEDALTAAMLAPWTGDLDGMIRRGYVRIGVANEPVFFGYDGAEQQGVTVDSAREFEKHLRATLGAEAATLTVTLAPLPRDRMIDALVAGHVDVLAANLTITQARAARVDFSDPAITNVSEIVVSGPRRRTLPRSKTSSGSRCGSARRAATTSILRR
jgi:ABC-type amino acid transport substrate-binding protein